MKSHIKSKSIQKCACLTLVQIFKILKSRRIREEVKINEAVCVVRRTMNSYIDNYGICYTGCAALKTIAELYNDSEQTNLLSTHKVLDLLKDILETDRHGWSFPMQIAVFHVTNEIALALDVKKNENDLISAVKILMIGLNSQDITSPDSLACASKCIAEICRAKPEACSVVIQNEGIDIMLKTISEYSSIKIILNALITVQNCFSRVSSSASRVSKDQILLDTIVRALYIEEWAHEENFIEVIDRSVSCLSLVIKEDKEGEKSNLIEVLPNTNILINLHAAFLKLIERKNMGLISKFTHIFFYLYEIGMSGTETTLTNIVDHLVKKDDVQFQVTCVEYYLHVHIRLKKNIPEMLKVFRNSNGITKICNILEMTKDAYRTQICCRFFDSILKNNDLIIKDEEETRVISNTLCQLLKSATQHSLDDSVIVDICKPLRILSKKK
mmetsp:Transcript_22416/g.29036  ORF Transcript_22416/g.29036 Transcript_22416/m.29036 type:complete len:442 (-) Transcript_22416:618-1943(-)